MGIALTRKERRELERTVRKATAAQRDARRARIVLLAAAGWGNAAVARALGGSRTTVVAWRKRFAERRREGLGDRPRSGRPPVYDDRTRVLVKAIACELPAARGLPLSRLSLADLHGEVRKELRPCPNWRPGWRASSGGTAGRRGRSGGRSPAGTSGRSWTPWNRGILSVAGGAAGVPIPEAVRADLRRRLEAHAAKHYGQTCRGVVLRFRGDHAYVGALVVHTWFLPGTTEAERERIRNTPVPLCRLTYLRRRDRWAFFFYKASDDRYERNVLMDGSWTGTPEDCFDCAAFAYLRDVW